MTVKHVPTEKIYKGTQGREDELLTRLFVNGRKRGYGWKQEA